MGIDVLEKYARFYGLGSKTGVELSSERAGIVACREDLKESTKTRMVVSEPIRLVIDNYEGEEYVDVQNGTTPEFGERKVLFSKELYIENDDFSQNPPPKYFR